MTKGTFGMTRVRDAVMGEAMDGRGGRLRPRTFDLIERTDGSGSDQ
jgi:hypothetical protein